MSSFGYGAGISGAKTIHCTRCARAMLVAREHIHTTVACPHCEQQLEPWRMAAAEGRRAMPQSGRRFDHPMQGVWGYSWRNRWVAGVLGVLLGALGVHRFYLGFVGIGIVQIMVSFVTLGIGGIWGFIEGVLCLAGSVMRDVDGLPLRH